MLDVGAVQVHGDEEAERKRKSEKDRREIERLRVVDQSFSAIIRSAQAVAETFNQQSDSKKIGVHSVSDRTFAISIEGLPGGRVVECQLLCIPPQKVQLEGMNVLAWGFVQVPQSIGFNIVLVRDDSVNPQGRWRTLHVRHSPLVPNPRTPEPFAFTFNQLPSEIALLGTTHSFEADVRDFSSEMLIPLIDQLF